MKTSDDYEGLLRERDQIINALILERNALVAALKPRITERDELRKELAEAIADRDALRDIARAILKQDDT